MDKDNLTHLANTFARHWVDSPYYDRAEEWTWLFWDPDHVFRRYFERLDLDAVVELACGHGRHSERMLHRARSLVLMDILASNIDFCRRRLGNHPNIEYLQNSGYDFRPLADASVSAIFCYDAMVHFPPEVVASYLVDTARVLRDSGMALYHHSNLTLSPGVGNTPGARHHMPQELFRELVAKAGLQLVETTTIPWAGVPDLDGVSLLAKPEDSAGPARANRGSSDERTRDG